MEHSFCFWEFSLHDESDTPLARSGSIIWCIANFNSFWEKLDYGRKFCSIILVIVPTCILHDTEGLNEIIANNLMMTKSIVISVLKGSYKLQGTLEWIVQSWWWVGIPASKTFISWGQTLCVYVAFDLTLTVFVFSVSSTLAAYHLLR